MNDSDRVSDAERNDRSLGVPGVSALVLAGGASRRMGAAKLLLEHEGETLLARSIASAQAVCERVVVVIGAYPESYRAVAERAGAEVIDNRGWREGLASSLRAGIEAVSESSAGALVLLADQPFVTVAHLERLLAAAERSGAELVFSRYPSGTLGAPALLRQSLFGRVEELRGERGAKALIGVAASVAEVALADARDIDTAEEAAAWLEGGSRS